VANFGRRPKRPSDVQQWPEGPDQGSEAAAGPSDPTSGSRRSEASNSELRNVAPQGKAEAEAPKQDLLH